MSDFDSQWKDATTDAQQGGTFDPPDDGTYTIELVKAVALTSKKGDDGVILELRDVASGYEWAVWLGFKSQGQANMTKTACLRLGVNVDEVASLTALNDALEPLAGGFFDVTVKTSGEYRNTYIDGASSGAQTTTDVPVPAAEMATAGASSSRDDIPF